jgi:hypothetical protein
VHVSDSNVYAPARPFSIDLDDVLCSGVAVESESNLHKIVTSGSVIDTAPVRVAGL